MKALGMIEVRGYLAAVEALDSALKAANVSLVDTVCVRGGLVTVLVDGEVGAVKAAMDASAAAAQRVGQILSVHVIPRPAEDVARMLEAGREHPGGDGPKGTPPGGDEPEQTMPDESGPKGTPPDGSAPVEAIPEAEAPEPDPKEQQEGMTPEAVLETPLDSMTVAALRSLARELGVTNLTRQEIRFAKKQELIHAILEYKRQEN